MPVWRDGQLHIAEDNRGKFVLVVEGKLDRRCQMFPIHKNIKSKTISQSNPSRCVIALRDGTLVHLNQAYPPHLQAFSEMLDFINNTGVPPNYTPPSPTSTRRTDSPYKAASAGRSPSELVQETFTMAEERVQTGPGPSHLGGVPEEEGSGQPRSKKARKEEEEDDGLEDLFRRQVMATEQIASELTVIRKIFAAQMGFEVGEESNSSQ